MDLKDCSPCPFCGSKALYWDLAAGTYGGPETIAVGCSNVNCNAIGPRGLSREEAVGKWNRREGEGQK